MTFAGTHITFCKPEPSFDFFAITADGKQRNAAGAPYGTEFKKGVIKCHCHRLLVHKLMKSVSRVKGFEEKAVQRVVVQLDGNTSPAKEASEENELHSSIWEEVQLERQKKYCAKYRRHKIFDGFLLGYRIILLLIVVWTMAFGCSLLEGW